MSRRSLTLLLVLLLVPAVTAGDAADPELADPAGDATVSPGQCKVGTTDADAAICNSGAGPGAATATKKADITGVWVSDVNETHYGIYIDTDEAGDADTVITLGFTVMRTADSLPGGMDNQTFGATITDTAVTDAPANTTASRNATDASIMEVVFTRADTGAVGGDAIQNVTVTVVDKQLRSGSPASQISRTDTTTDSTEGDSRPYNLTRPAKAGNIAMTLTGGSLTESINGTDVVTSFTGGEVALNQSVNGTAMLTYTLTLTNNGLDPDTAVLSILDASGLAGRNITATVDPTSATLAPGETIPVAMSIMLNNTPAADHTVFAQATTTLGGYGFASTTITVPPRPAPPPVVVPPTEPEPVEEERKLAVAGLGFLTPAAEAMGLVEPFGEYAELVLLAIILLLVILVLFLIIFLATRGSIKIRIEPRKMDIAPGQTAEFRVEIKNRKGNEVDALASFEGDPEWTTSLSFAGHEMTAAGTDAAMHLGSKKDDSGVRHGILKVTAPQAADDKEADRVTVAVAPLRDDGTPRKAQKTQIRVRAHADAAPVGHVRLAGVEHDPSHPEAGQVVETTARIENDSDDEALRLRVVLNVDGEDLQEQPLTLPPQQARAVVFTWQVPSGTSKVRVRIYADE